MDSFRIKFRLVAIALACVLPLIWSFSSNAQSMAYSSAPGVSAVDAKGVRHHASDYPNNRPPWVDDQIKAVAPYYSVEDRGRRREGAGLFRLTLDLRTGSVRKIKSLKSTAFRTLDDSAVFALEKWRWKSGKWREIDMPVRFELSKEPPRLPPGATRIP